MAILLLILKILLIIIVALLFLVLYFCFVPIFLHLEIEKKDKDFFVYYKANTFLRAVLCDGKFKDKTLNHNERLLWGLIRLNKRTNSSDETKSDKKTKQKKRIDLNKIKGMMDIQFIKKVFNAVLYLFKANRAIVKKLNLEYAFDEPDKTGMLSGGLALIPFIYECEPGVFPDFESDESYFNIETIVDVRLFLFTLLVAFIKIKK